MTSRTLKLGDQGDDVADVQHRLGVTADGRFGAATYTAVANFQHTTGLAEDGVVGQATWERLRVLGASTGAPRTYGPDDVGPDGWYPRATRIDAHRGRVGAAISPWGIVIHTTDMLEDTFDALVQRWRLEPGDGACAHWIIGRTAAQGVIQMISAYRNSNHAGGSRKVGDQWVPWHGNFQLPGGGLIHPNSCTLGIEVHNAGYLGRRTSRGYVHRDSGRVVPDQDVFVDTSGRGWHRFTSYQLEELGRLVKAARAMLRTAPTGVTIAPNGGYQENAATWAVVADPRISGHATLDPQNKTDPGPEIMQWIRSL